jgi:hypothetical protein
LIRGIEGAWSGGAFEQLSRFALELQSCVLMGLPTCERGDALNEIEDRLCGVYDYADHAVPIAVVLGKIQLIYSA